MKSFRRRFMVPRSDTAQTAAVCQSQRCIQTHLSGTALHRTAGTVTAPRRAAPPTTPHPAPGSTCIKHLRLALAAPQSHAWHPSYEIAVARYANGALGVPTRPSPKAVNSCQYARITAGHRCHPGVSCLPKKLNGTFRQPAARHSAADMTFQHYHGNIGARAAPGMYSQSSI